MQTSSVLKRTLFGRTMRLGSSIVSHATLSRATWLNIRPRSISDGTTNAPRGKRRAPPKDSSTTIRDSFGLDHAKLLQSMGSPDQWDAETCDWNEFRVIVRETCQLDEDGFYSLPAEGPIASRIELPQWCSEKRRAFNADDGSRRLCCMPDSWSGTIRDWKSLPKLERRAMQRIWYPMGSHSNTGQQLRLGLRPYFT